MEARVSGVASSSSAPFPFLQAGETAVFIELQNFGSDQRRHLTPGFQDTLERCISFSRYNTLERLIRGVVRYLSSLKEGYEMTILD